ncbi:MAG: glycosyltransferase [Thermoanaerobaculia bacterium]
MTRELRALYTSSPDRGLDIVLELWPSVRERVPDATLAYCYPEVYERVAEQDPTVAQHRDLIAKLADQPGVERLGSLSQPRLAQLMLSSLVWCHPSWATPGACAFHETSCIGAMEAQAAGCWVVASDWGALSETVKVGALVDSEPPGEKWRASFVAEIVRGLTDEETQRYAQTEGPAAVADLTWDGVAKPIARLVKAGWKG